MECALMVFGEGAYLTRVTFFFGSPQGYVARVTSVVLHTCTTWHGGERIICYRTPPGVSLTFGPAAFPPGFRVVLDVDTAPLPLAVAVWDYETITDLDATAVPLGYV